MISTERKKRIVDRMLLILTGLLVSGYFLVGSRGQEKLSVLGHAPIVNWTIAVIAIVLILSARLLMSLRWTDAFLFVLDVTWPVFLMEGMFIGARDVLGLHWSIACLMTMPLLVVVWGTILRYQTTKTPEGLATVERRKRLVSGLVAGSVCDGRVEKVMKHGAIINIAPEVTGLLFESQVTDAGGKRVADVLKNGDTVKVRIDNIDREGRVRLSMKSLGNADFDPHAI